MKGVAIIFMLYLHLFNQTHNINLCENFIYLNDLPLAHILTRATNPVPFFLILSGYGLYVVQEKNGNYNILKKLKALYVHYWISLLIFVSIGATVVGIQRYPGNWECILSNVTAWHTTYNGEVWFLFPYCLMALSSKYLFRLMETINIWLFMLVALLLTFVAGFLISRYGEAYLYHNQLVYMPILYMDLLFAFVAGAGMAKYRIIDKFRNDWGGGQLSRRVRSHAIWFILLVLIALRCLLRTGAFHNFYAILFIILFVSAPRPLWLNKILEELGKRSTSMWFVHSYFCYYLFHDFIYSFRYPLFIFIALLLCSYLSAVIIDYLNRQIQKFAK